MVGYMNIQHYKKENLSINENSKERMNKIKPKKLFIHYKNGAVRWEKKLSIHSKER
jgi:hypothetical protein